METLNEILKAIEFGMHTSGFEKDNDYGHGFAHGRQPEIKIEITETGTETGLVKKSSVLLFFAKPK